MVQLGVVLFLQRLVLGLKLFNELFSLLVFGIFLKVPLCFKTQFWFVDDISGLMVFWLELWWFLDLFDLIWLWELLLGRIDNRYLLVFFPHTESWEPFSLFKHFTLYNITLISTVYNEFQGALYYIQMYFNFTLIHHFRHVFLYISRIWYKITRSCTQKERILRESICLNLWIIVNRHGDAYKKSILTIWCFKIEIDRLNTLSHLFQEIGPSLYKLLLLITFQYGYTFLIRGHSYSSQISFVLVVEFDLKPVVLIIFHIFIN